MPGTSPGGSPAAAGLLLLLFFYRRRLYILFWTGGWLLVSSSMLSRGVHSNPKVDSLARSFTVSHPQRPVQISADAYLARPRRRGYAIVLLAVLLRFVLACSRSIGLRSLPRISSSPGLWRPPVSAISPYCARSACWVRLSAWGCC
jgi:hypothetical protein